MRVATILVTFALTLGVFGHPLSKPSNGGDVATISGDASDQVKTIEPRNNVDEIQLERRKIWKPVVPVQAGAPVPVVGQQLGPALPVVGQQLGPAIPVVGPPVGPPIPPLKLDAPKPVVPIQLGPGVPLGTSEPFEGEPTNNPGTSNPQLNNPVTDDLSSPQSQPVTTDSSSPQADPPLTPPPSTKPIWGKSSLRQIRQSSCYKWFEGVVSGKDGIARPYYCNPDRPGGLLGNR